MLGKLEEVILLAALRVGANALPIAIYEELVRSTPPGGKEPAFGAIYTTLNRMEAKKLVTLGKLVDDKGRDRRTFTVSAAGQSALRESVGQVAALGGFKLAGGLA